MKRAKQRTPYTVRIIGFISKTTTRTIRRNYGIPITEFLNIRTKRIAKIIDEKLPGVKVHRDGNSIVVKWPGTLRREDL